MTERNLSIFQLGMHFDPSSGGADRYFAGLLQGLEFNGQPFTAAAFGAVPEAIPSCLSLGSQNASLASRLIAIHRMGRQLLTGRHVLASHFALYALPLLGKFRKTPHVVHFHGPWAGESAGEGQRPLAVAAKYLTERIVYHSARRLVALSTAFRDILIRDYHLPEKQIAVIPGGVEMQRFRPAGNKRTLRQQLGWPEDKKIVFCVRRLVPRMGLETLIDAFARIAPAHPEAALILGGRGPLTGKLQEQIQSLGLGDRIRLAGFIPEEKLPDAYGAADFSMVPSQALEGFGLITLESLACGTPVLVTPVGGLPETVKGLDDSLVLSGSNVDALAQGLKRGLAQPLPSSSACREYVEKNFSWPLIAGRIGNIYREAADDSLR